MLEAIAIDDEPMALEVIKSHASKVPFIHLKGTFTNAIQALDYLRENPVQLLFLDIKMPDISGMELAEMIPATTMVVFTTAYSEHAVKSFELDAIDYLLKPFPLSRFLKACQKAKTLYDLKSQSKSDGYFYVKSGYEQVKVTWTDLLFCEAAGNYVTFYMNNQKVMGRMTLSEAAQQLPDHFVQTHRSFIVNAEKIDKIERHQLHLGGKAVPVSSSFLEGLQEVLGRLSEMRRLSN
ncbi:LytR/AlgR family response regulator transcription factor [Pararhodonellum marinum]|uniref:LytR/AlgR family response regulator transcription factor n=1 Tax=Pararhodonellum marinum TaxID=2755358 RepID=UPI00188E8525|nr:LytTR family DNA-binding domain-containing protein [Pararhodonellum marinum]